MSSTNCLERETIDVTLIQEYNQISTGQAINGASKIIYGVFSKKLSMVAILQIIFQENICKNRQELISNNYNSEHFTLKVKNMTSLILCVFSILRACDRALAEPNPNGSP